MTLALLKALQTDKFEDSLEIGKLLLLKTRLTIK
jgi:hypothetical protein